MKLFEYARLHPQGTLAVTDGGQTLFYRDILTTSEEHFAPLGRSLVFLLCKNDPGSLLAYLGALYSDAVPLLLDAGLSPALFDSLFAAYKPPYCLLPQEQITMLPGEYKVLGRIWGSVLVSTDFRGPELHPDLKLLLTTSGSTGSPKLVRLSRENLDANAASIVEYLELTDGERPITTLPMHYSYGMSVINSHVYCGGTIILTEHTLMERSFWQRAREATSFSGVPFTYQLLDRLKLPVMDLPNLRTLTQAGGRLSQSLQEKFGTWCQETNRRFFIMYGQTEASPRMSYLPPNLAVKKPGSIGIPIPGGQFRILGEDGTEIRDAGVTGELLYMGKNVSLGYALEPGDLKKGDENQGLLFTGDMAYLGSDGLYYIAGRKARFIKIRGFRYNLDELEDRLRQRFPQGEFACVGRDDMLNVFYVNLNEPDRDELKQEMMDVFGVPKKYFCLSALSQLPVTSTGKRDYGALSRLSG